MGNQNPKNGTYTAKCKEGEFTGEWKDGQPYKGKMVYGDMCTYEGEFRHGKRSGQGKISWPDGSSYDGDWWDNNYHGRGILTKINEYIYDGEWFGGKKYGQGKITYADGTSYIGEWASDEKDGKGVITNLDGSTCEENWTYGKLRTIKMTKSDGSSYEGQWPWGSNGIIKLINPDGSIFEGSISDKNKAGRMTWPNGSCYEGVILDDKKHGRGKMSWPNGSCYDGNWVYDVKHGPCTWKVRINPSDLNLDIDHLCSLFEKQPNIQEEKYYELTFIGEMKNNFFAKGDLFIKKVFRCDGCIWDENRDLQCKCTLYDLLKQKTYQLHYIDGIETNNTAPLNETAAAPAFREEEEGAAN